MSDAGDITIEGARELVSNRLLWPRVRDFLWDFAPQVDASWLDVAAFPVSRLMSSPRVKRHILDSLGVKPCFHSFPEGDGSRLLLLDGETLEKISKWLGALACADALRRVTGGAAVRELKAALPGVYPEVFGYTAYFKGLDSAADGEGVAEKTIAVGSSLLLSAVAHLPEALVERLKFKFRKDSAFASLASDSPSGSADVREKPAAKQEAAKSSIFKLLKLKFPEAYKLCCS